MTDTSTIDAVQDINPNLGQVQDQSSSLLSGILPTLNTLTDSIFDQAQKPEIDPTTGKPKPPPVGSTLDDLMALGKNVTDQMQGIVGTVQGLVTKNDAATQAQTDAIKDSGLQSKIIQDIQTSQQLKTAKDNAAVQGAFGLDPNQSNYDLLQRVQSIKQQQEDVNAKGKELEQLKSATILDDPWNFLKNKIVGPAKESGYEQAVQNYNTQLAQIKANQDMTTDAFIKNKALDEVTTATTGAALDKQIADTTAIKASQSQQEGLKYDMSGVNPMIAATDTQWKAAQGINTAMAQQQSLLLEGQGLVLRQREADINDIFKKEKEGALQDKQDYIHAMDQRIATMNQTAGTNLQGYQAYKVLPQTEQAAYDRLMTPASAAGIAGFTPAEAIANLQRIPRAPNVGLDSTIRTLDNQAEIARNPNNTRRPGQPSFRSLTPEQRLDEENSAIINYTSNSLRNIPDSGNIYSMPTMSVMTSIPTVMASDLGKKLTPLGQADSLAATKANTVFRATVDMVKAGKPIDQAAKEFSNFYTAGMLANNAANQYRTVNVPVLSSEHTGYNVNIDGAGIIDASNQTRVKQAITRYLLNEQVQQAREGYNTGFN